MNKNFLKAVEAYKEIQDDNKQLQESKAQQQATIEKLSAVIPITIIGNDYFKSRTLEALYIIQLKSQKKYNAVIKYIKKIQQSTNNSRWHENNLINKTFLFSQATYSSVSEWYASSIVHDSYHSKLYNDYREVHRSNSVPYNIYGGENGEYACLEYQISFLEEICAADYLIKHAKSERTSRWWENNNSTW